MSSTPMFHTDQLYTVKEKDFQQVSLKIQRPVAYQRYVFILIAVIAFLKILAAFWVELGNDESYYWLYSQQLKWNYFDHPPMVALWIRLFTANLRLEEWEGFIRLGSIVACALSTWLMYKTVAQLHSERAGWLAACLYSASYYAGSTAGLFVIPDAPQMVFWTFCLWMIAKITQEEKAWIYWIALGVGAGLCIMSKVHGVFIWLGLGLFVLLKKRAWLTQPRLYVALLLTLLIASPILIWNMQHDFVTYRFHSQRVTVDHFAFNSHGFLKEIVSQFFYNNPFNVALIVLTFIAWNKSSFRHLPALSVYNYMALPLVFLLLLIAVFKDNTLPHWSGPAYVTLLPLAAIRLAEVDKRPLFPHWLKASLGAFLLVIITLILAIQFWPGTLGSKDPKQYGKGDLTLDYYGWRQAAQQFAVQYQNDVRQGVVPPHTPVVSYKWWGAHIEYYFCRPFKISMIGLGPVNELHEYMWWNKERKNSVNLSQAYCIVPADEYYDVQKKYAPYYSHIQWVRTIVTYRSHRPAHLFHVYRLKGWKGSLPVAK